MCRSWVHTSFTLVSKSSSVWRHFLLSSLTTCERLTIYFERFPIMCRLRPSEYETYRPFHLLRCLNPSHRRNPCDGWLEGGLLSVNNAVFLDVVIHVVFVQVDSRSCRRRRFCDRRQTFAPTRKVVRKLYKMICCILHGKLFTFSCEKQNIVFSSGRRRMSSCTSTAEIGEINVFDAVHGFVLNAWISRLSQGTCPLFILTSRIDLWPCVQHGSKFNPELLNSKP